LTPKLRRVARLGERAVDPHQLIPLFLSLMDSRDIALLETYRALRSLLSNALALIDREIDAMEAGFDQFERDMDALREED
jgi:hypothetical protein